MKKPRLFTREDFARGMGLAYVNFVKENPEFAEKNFTIDLKKYLVQTPEMEEPGLYYYSVVLNGTHELSEEEFNFMHNESIHRALEWPEQGQVDDDDDD